MDILIPRAKVPATALPPEIRRKMGLQPRNNDENNNIYQAGSGVLARVGSGNDGSYLKMKSGIAMSHRTSAKSRADGLFIGKKAYIPKAKILTPNPTLMISNQ